MKTRRLGRAVVAAAAAAGAAAAMLIAAPASQAYTAPVFNTQAFSAVYDIEHAANQTTVWPDPSRPGWGGLGTSTVTQISGLPVLSSVTTYYDAAFLDAYQVSKNRLDPYYASSRYVAYGANSDPLHATYNEAAHISCVYADQPGNDQNGQVVRMVYSAAIVGGTPHWWLGNVGANDLNIPAADLATLAAAHPCPAEAAQATVSVTGIHNIKGATGVALQADGSEKLSGIPSGGTKTTYHAGPARVDVAPVYRTLANAQAKVHPVYVTTPGDLESSANWETWTDCQKAASGTSQAVAGMAFWTSVNGAADAIYYGYTALTTVSPGGAALPGVPTCT